MPFKCTLTSENLTARLNSIRNAYRLYNETKDIDLCFVTLSRFYELFCQAWFINQDIDVHWKLVEKTMKLSNSASKLIHLIKQIRDELTHDLEVSDAIINVILAIDTDSLVDDCEDLTTVIKDTDGSVSEMLVRVLTDIREHYSKK